MAYLRFGLKIFENRGRDFSVDGETDSHAYLGAGFGK